jgi:hypothetical protein
MIQFESMRVSDTLPPITAVLLSKVAQEITLLTCVWNASDLNADYPDWVVRFSLAIAGKYRDSTSNYTTAAFLHILSNPLFTNHRTIRCYTIVELKASLNKSQINTLLYCHQL